MRDLGMAQINAEELETLRKKDSTARTKSLSHYLYEYSLQELLFNLGLTDRIPYEE